MNSLRFWHLNKNVFLYRKTSNFFIVFISALFLCAVGFGCSAKSTPSNFYEQLDVIDSLIAQNLIDDALGDLKKIEKNAFDPMIYIGIYKRYVLLGENKLAEKTLKDALKKNPKNPKLTVVYVSFLNQQGRLAEAEKLGKNLRDTPYASIYAELVFKNHSSEFSKQDAKFFYEDVQYYNLFFDSYQTSKNPVWIRNCADFYLSKGEYASAASLTPYAFYNADDAYFWAMVNYDAGNYLDAVKYVQSAFEFLDSLNKKSALFATEIRLSALESDSYMSVSDMPTAQGKRDRIVAEYVTANSDLNALSADEKIFLPLLILNSAIFANESGRDQDAADLLLFTVFNFPEYVPGLISYADFAYNSNLVREEDDEMVALRKAGIRSLEMERYDNRAKLPLADAISRINHALATLHDPYLYITKIDLQFKTDPSLTVKDKTAELWRLLEQSSTETVKYHDALVLYAVNFLLETKQTEDAEAIFDKYIRSKFGLKTEGDFFEQMQGVIENASIDDIEAAAWFAASHKRIDAAVQMYEHCAFGNAKAKSSEISTKVSTQSLANLANIYYSLGKKDAALDLYGKIASMETNPILRSEIFYRIASIHYDSGDNQNALRAADYSYSINPQNAKAHLLKTKLK